MTTARSATGRVLRNPNFVRLWLGQMVSFIGDYFYFLAIPIMVERLTGSTLMVGLSVISSAVPMLLLGPVAGVFVDRWDRKRTMIVADVLRGLLVLLCLLVQTRELVWVYYLAGFLMSCAGRFFFPARNAVMPLIVRDKDDLLAANGLMQAIEMVGLLAGPALAGVTIGLWGASVAFLADSASFFISAIAIYTMYLAPRPAGQPVTSRHMASVWTELREGVVALFGSRTMMGVLMCMAVLQLGLGAINVLWVPYLKRTFGIGPEGLGLVDALQGAGMVVGGLALGFVASRLHKSTIVGVSVAVIGLLLSAMGLAPAFVYIAVISFALGLLITPAESALMTLMQLAVPDRKRGRVGSALNALVTLAGLLSMAAAASLGDLVGLRTIYIACGLIVLISGLLAARIPEPIPEELATVPGPPVPAGLPGDEEGPVQAGEVDYWPVPVTLDHGGAE